MTPTRPTGGTGASPGHGTVGGMLMLILWLWVAAAVAITAVLGAVAVAGALFRTLLGFWRSARWPSRQPPTACSKASLAAWRSSAGSGM